MFIEETPPPPGKLSVPSAAPLPAAGKAPVPVTADAGMLQAWNLKRRVRAACGHLVQEVLVVQQPDHTLLVKVRVDDAAAQNQVLDEIRNLPEIADPQVHLQVDRAR
jgi:hypothetical protein